MVWGGGSGGSRGSLDDQGLIFVFVGEGEYDIKSHQLNNFRTGFKKILSLLFLAVIQQLFIL